MKQQAKQSFDKPSQIMTQAMSQIDVAARVDLGREESIKRTLRNQRLGRIPPQPESLQDLLPIDDLPAGLEFLRNNTPEGMEPLLNYFDATYCTGTYRRIQRHAPDGDGQDAIMLRRIAPLFPPQIWNVHQVTIDGEQRTNNLCEAWNHRIEHLCGVSHPSVWKLIHWLKADSAHVSTTLLNAARGEPPRKHVKRVYTQLQSRLHQLCVDRRDGNKTVEEFLRGAGHNIRWKPHCNQNQVVE